MADVLTVISAVHPATPPRTPGVFNRILRRGKAPLTPVATPSPLNKKNGSQRRNITGATFLRPRKAPPQQEHTPASTPVINTVPPTLSTLQEAIPPLPEPLGSILSTQVPVAVKETTPSPPGSGCVFIEPEVNMYSVLAIGSTQYSIRFYREFKDTPAPSLQYPGQVAIVYTGTPVAPGNYISAFFGRRHFIVQILEALVPIHSAVPAPTTATVDAPGPRVAIDPPGMLLSQTPNSHNTPLNHLDHSARAREADALRPIATSSSSSHLEPSVPEAYVESRGTATVPSTIAEEDFDTNNELPCIPATPRTQNLPATNSQMAQSSLVERPCSVSGHRFHSQRDNVDNVFGPRAPPSRPSIPSEWWDGNGNCGSSDAMEENPPLPPNFNQQDPILPSRNLGLTAVLGLDEPQVTPFLRRKLNSQIQDNEGMYPPGLGFPIRLISEVSDRSDSSEEINALPPAVSTSKFQEELTEALYVQDDENSHNNNHGNAEPNRNPFRNHQDDNSVTPLPSNVQNNATLEAESLVNFLNYILRCLNNPTQVREVFHEHIEPFTRMIRILEQQCAYLGPTGFIERLTSQDDVFLRLWDNHIVFMKPWLEIVAVPIPLVNPNIVDWQVIHNMTRSLRVRAQTLCKTVTVPVDFTRYFDFWEQHYQLLEHYHDSVIRCIKDFAPNTTNSTQASSAGPNVAYRGRQAANIGRDVISSSQKFSPGSEYSNDSPLQGTPAEFSGKHVEKGNYKGKEKEQNLSDTSARTFREPLVSTYDGPPVASTSGSSLRPEDVVKEPESSNNVEVVDIFSYEQTYDALSPEDPMYDAFGGEPNWNLPIIGEEACVPIVQGSLPHP